MQLLIDQGGKVSLSMCDFVEILSSIDQYNNDAERCEWDKH